MLHSKVYYGQLLDKDMSKTMKGQRSEFLAAAWLISINYLVYVKTQDNDPIDLVEDDEHYTNSLKVIGTLNPKNSKIQLFARDRSINTDNKFPPDRSAVEYQVNEDKINYIVYDDMEYKPQSKLIHNCDAVFHFKKGHYLVGYDCAIGFNNQIKFTKYGNHKEHTIKVSDLKCFHIITDIKIKNTR